MLKISLQFFAEGDPAVETVTPPAPKTFSEDYVKTLREEARDNRIARKNYESKLKSIIGLKDDDEISDDKITAYQTKHQQELTATITKANDRLLQAEIKSLEGYDHKLVSRLMDKSKIKIDEDGNITGLNEAITELEKEFPQIKKSSTQTNSANPVLPVSQTAQEEYNQALKDAQANPRNSELTKKVFLLKERLRN